MRNYSLDNVAAALERAMEPITQKILLDPIISLRLGEVCGVRFVFRAAKRPANGA